MNEFKTSYALGKRIELSAISDVTKELFRFVRCESQHADAALRWTDEAGNKVHQGGLAGSVWSDQTCHAGRKSKVHAIHAKDLSVKLGDVFENDAAVRGGHERSTSRARSLRSSSQKHAVQRDNREAHAAHSGTTSKPEE